MGIFIIGEREDLPRKDSVKEERQVAKELKYVASIKRHPGQHLYKCEVKTEKITIVGDDEFKIEVDLKGEVKKSLIMDKGSMYTTAINLKNARRKFVKLLAAAIST